MELEPVFCGDNKDEWVQEREQWHSGANFFAFAPGKIIGYQRNISTITALNNSGFEVLEAEDVISGRKNIEDYQRCVVTMEGSELARGGGGCRCMTMPVRRQPVDWPK
jgi:arginine deiminase